MQPIRIQTVVMLLGAVLAGCSAQSNTSDAFVIHNTTVGAAGTTHMAITGHNLAFLASEGSSGPAGTDFNGDGDMIDSIAVAVQMAAHTQYNLGVAATDLAWVGNDLYLVVNEALDGRDWNNDLDMNDIVLLHWSIATHPALPDYVDDLSSATLPQFVAVGPILFYTAASTPVGANLSNLKAITAAAPLVGTTIMTQDPVAELTVQILGQDGSLLFLGLDETVNGRDLNNDLDALDTHVLALLDATITTGIIRSTELAVPSAAGPFRARRIDTHDWQVGFLVNEADQGNTNLNDPALFDPAWQAAQCAAVPDADTNDNVLHFINFAAWDGNPVAQPPRNTGLAGRDKIAIASGFIACICAEADEGTCDLNQDGDMTDNVVRWTQIVSGVAPILPLNAAANLHALFDCPGGTHGLSELGADFMIEVSEASDNIDIDGDALKTKNILGWLLPSNSSHAWDFTPTTTANWAGASWMREKYDRTRLNVAYQESVNGTNINVHFPPVAGEDTDTNDSVPTFAYFPVAGSLSYPGVAIAVSAANAGIIVAGDAVYYRVDEAADSRDWNGDGDETDMILFRTSLSQGTSVAMGPLNNVPARLAVDADELGAPAGAAFLADESMQGAGFDFNGDGDTNDLVVRYFIY
jgi:hypothetical protein